MSVKLEDLLDPVRYEDGDRIIWYGFKRDDWSAGIHTPEAMPLYLIVKKREPEPESTSNDSPKASTSGEA